MGSFAEWIAQVDARMIAQIGLGYMDIPDQTWHDWFDAGYEPAEAVEEALENEGMVL